MSSRISISLSSELRKELESAARNNGVSLSREITNRLELLDDSSEGSSVAEGSGGRMSLIKGEKPGVVPRASKQKIAKAQAYWEKAAEEKRKREISIRSGVK